MRLVVLGAGGFGRTIKDIAEQMCKYSDIVMLDDDGEVEPLCDFKKYIDDRTFFYPALGNNQLRYSWMQKLKEANAEVVSIIHESAYISPTAKIGKGVAILPKAIINTNVILSDANIINIGAIIDHDNFLGKGVHIAPGAIVKGDNVIPDFTKIESGTVIENNITV